MSSRKGIRVALSPARRIVVELMHHAKKVPSIPLRRSMNVVELVQARSQCSPRPSWVAMFLKAFALVARDHSELRQTYVPWPWPSIYQHPISECAVLVEREVMNENAVMAAKVRTPDEQPLTAIDEHLHRLSSAPLNDVSDFRQLMRLSRIPALLRRFVFWNTLYLSGFTKCKRFGTFMVSSLGNCGVEQCHPLTTLSTYLSFGPIRANGDVTALVVYDHRVMDGRTVARALMDLEATMNGPILAEVKQRQHQAAA